MVLPHSKMNPPQAHMCSPYRALLPPPRHHPPGSSQDTSPKHPASCIEPGLATRFTHDIIHVSMPFSQIIPPSPSPSESKRLFSWVSLLLSRIQGYRRRQWHPTPVLLPGKSEGFETWIEVSWVWNGLRTCKCDGLVSSIPKKGLQSLSLSENNRRSFWNICLGNLYDGWWSILNPYQQMILYHSTF